VRSCILLTVLSHVVVPKRHAREAIFAQSGMVERYTGLLEERRRSLLPSRELGSLTSERGSTSMAVIHLPGGRQCSTGEGSTAEAEQREDTTIYTIPTNEFVVDEVREPWNGPGSAHLPPYVNYSNSDQAMRTLRNGTIFSVHSAKLRYKRSPPISRLTSVMK
jgi:hypothetical protein